MTNETAVTFHPATSTLACDICGAVVDSSDRGRSLHQQWHNQTSEVIDLTGRVVFHLDRLAEAS